MLLTKFIWLLVSVENNLRCLSCICHTEICDSELSFHESKQTLPVVNAISSDFLCVNFNVKKDVFSRNICLAQVFSGFFVCVHMY